MCLLKCNCAPCLPICSVSGAVCGFIVSVRMLLGCSDNTLVTMINTQIVELRDVYLAAHDFKELLTDVVAGLAHQAQHVSKPLDGGKR